MISHWRQQMVDGAEHLISCHWLPFLCAFSHLQLIQNSAPNVGVNVTSDICHIDSDDFDNFCCLLRKHELYQFLVQLGSCHKLVQNVPSSEKPGKEKGAFLCIALLLSAPCRSWKKLKFLEFLISFQALWVVIATIQLYKYPNCHKLQRRRNTNQLMTLYSDVIE